MFPFPLCGEKFHKIELKKYVGYYSPKKKKKNVATIKINIDTN